MSKELKPCPFCGGDADFEHLESGRWSAGCREAKGECIGFQVLASYARKADAQTAWNTRVPRLPDREEVARKLNEEFGSREWDAVPADRRELKILVSSYRGGKVAAYSIAEDTKEDFLISADRILAMMEGRG